MAVARLAMKLQQKYLLFEVVWAAGPIELLLAIVHLASFVILAVLRKELQCSVVDFPKLESPTNI